MAPALLGEARGRPPREHTMSMSDLEAAQRLVADHADRARFIGPRSPSTVAAAESALGHSFPPTYRRFVTEHGAGSLGGREFYGVTRDEWVPLVPNAIGLTLDERETNDMPEAYIIVGDTGDGDSYVIDTTQTDADGEAPVLIWMPGVPPQDAGPLEKVADSFGSFFLDRVQRGLAD
jgi:hypothetical protein